MSQSKDDVSVGSSKRSDIPQLVHAPAVDAGNFKQGSSVSDSSDKINIDDTMAIPSLTRHLKVNRPKGFLSRRSSADLPRTPSAFGLICSSISEERYLTGRSRRSMPELPKSIEQIDEF